MHPRVYLDHNATAPLRPEALAAMRPFLEGPVGNPSSAHAEGRRARQAIERARAQVAALLNAHPDEVVFTSGGTESNNLAIFGCLHAARRRGRRVIATPLEHPSVLAPLTHLARLGAASLALLDPLPGGLLNLASLARALDDPAALVTLMTAHNELGVRYPIAQAARLAHAHGALVHSDAVQAAGKVALDVSALDVDTLALSAHKLGGPRGVGALFVRRGLTLEPLLRGGGQERGLRSGTENVAGLVGLGAAAAACARDLDAHATRALTLRERLWRGVARLRPDALRNSPPDGLPNTLHVSFPDTDGPALVAELDRRGVAASTGSACHTGAHSASALRRAGLAPWAVHGALRLSLGPDTDEAAIDQALRALADALPHAACLPPA